MYDTESPALTTPSPSASSAARHPPSAYATSNARRSIPGNAPSSAGPPRSSRSSSAPSSPSKLCGLRSPSRTAAADAKPARTTKHGPSPCHKWARCEWVVIHECAHLLTDREHASHGAHDMKNYIRLLDQSYAFALLPSGRAAHLPDPYRGARPDRMRQAVRIKSCRVTRRGEPASRPPRPRTGEHLIAETASSPSAQASRDHGARAKRRRRVPLSFAWVFIALGLLNHSGKIQLMKIKILRRNHKSKKIQNVQAEGSAPCAQVFLTDGRRWLPSEC
jgi:hypothetical protein